MLEAAEQHELFSLPAFHQLLCSPRESLESEPGSSGNLGSQTYYCLTSSTVFSHSDLNGVFLPGSTTCKPSSCAYK